MDLARLPEFYKKALKNEQIGYIFTEVAQLDMEEHLPIICDFWEAVLLGGRQRGNKLKTHLDLHKKTALQKKHFDIWLALFKETTDQFFEGDRADLAKERALSIATVMQIKIQSPDQN